MVPKRNLYNRLLAVLAEIHPRFLSGSTAQLGSLNNDNGSESSRIGTAFLTASSSHAQTSPRFALGFTFAAAPLSGLFITTCRYCGGKKNSGHARFVQKQAHTALSAVEESCRFLGREFQSQKGKKREAECTISTH